MTKVLVVGAGFSGSVVARELASFGCNVHIIDERDHIAGNCHTERDEKTDIMVHTYGPHIFNTNIPRVWEYVNKYGEWVPYVNRVKASIDSGVYSLPINLHTINQFFQTNFNPTEARKYIQKLASKDYPQPTNFEEQALSMIGKNLYESFFKGYTQKQWGCDPTELPASILKRLPVRFNYDDNYYNSKWQAIPKNGYTQIVQNIISHENITLELGRSWDVSDNDNYDLVIYTGPIDKYFNYAHGKLGYRTVFWEKEYGKGDLQGNAVINYPSTNQLFTRVHEHKHFTPWESHDQSVIFTEFSKETEQDDIPYYPKRLSEDMKILSKYQEDIAKQTKVKFVGRLATYRYLNMDAIISEALDLSDIIKKGLKTITMS